MSTKHPWTSAVIWASLGLGLLAFAGCAPELESGCVTNNECGEGEVCQAGECQPASSDADEGGGDTVVVDGGRDGGDAGFGGENDTGERDTLGPGADGTTDTSPSNEASVLVITPGQLTMNISRLQEVRAILLDEQGREVDLEGREIEWSTSDASVVEIYEPGEFERDRDPRNERDAGMAPRPDVGDAGSPPIEPDAEQTAPDVGPGDAGAGDGSSSGDAGMDDGSDAAPPDVRMLRGASVGEATVTAKVGSFEATIDVTVEDAPTKFVQVTPSSQTIQVGEQTQFEARVVDVFGNPLPGSDLTWDLGNSEVAEIVDEEAGTIRANQTGTTTVVARTSNGEQGRATLNIQPVQVEGIDIRPSDPSQIAQGASVSLLALPLNASSDPICSESRVSQDPSQPCGYNLEWTSGAPSIATVQDDGNVLGQSEGEATLFARIQNVQATVTIQVGQSSSNEPPTARAGSDRSATPGSTVQLDASGSTDDGVIQEYRWVFQDVPSGANPTLRPDNTEIDPTFTPSTSGTYTIVLIVTDNSGQTDVAQVQITANEAPVAKASADANPVLVGQTVNLDGSGSNDPDGQIQSYAWSFERTPSGASPSFAPDASTAQPSFDVSKTGQYEVKLTVTDNQGLTSSDTLTVLAESNQPPTADAGQDQTLGLAGNTTTTSLDGRNSSDPDGSSLTYTWSVTQAPSNSSPNLTNAQSSRPDLTVDTLGTYEIRLTVVDAGGKSDSDTVTITVQAAPQAETGPDRTVSSQSQVQLDGSGSSDPDGTIQTYRWSFASTPSNVSSPPSFQPSNDTVDPTFTPSQPGRYEVQLEVTDDRGATRTDTVVITVNAPPVADAGVDKTVQPNTQIQLDGSLSDDPDGTISSYSWSFQTTPSGASPSFNPGADKVAPTVTFSQEGTYQLQLQVTDDNGATGTDTLQIDVDSNVTNQSPTAEATASSTKVSIGAKVQLDGSGSSDPDGAIQRYQWRFEATPSGVSPSFSDPTIAKPTFTPDQNGTYGIVLIVWGDKGIKATASVTVTVQSPNQPPNAEAGPTQTVTPQGGQTAEAELDGTKSSDPDGTIQSYQWTVVSQASGSSPKFDDATIPQPTLTLDQIGTYEVQLKVTDNRGGTDTDTVIIEVELPASNQPPVADAGSDQTVSLQSGTVDVQLNGSNSFDPDGSIQEYAWTVVNKPSGSNPSFDDPTIVRPTLTLDKTGLYELRLRVTDDSQATDSDILTIEVQ